ncbi:MAG: HAD-IIIA family hydrolase [Planctomycetota bacterium]|nr:MAG: HAD-IIIA family hydrolase [Planctomycetota bacterium]
MAAPTHGGSGYRRRYTRRVPGQPTVFLDRDGTLLKEVPYLDSARRAELLPGVAEALTTLHQAGLLLIVVSNQSGVARGLLDEGVLLAIQERIDAELAAHGARIDAYYHCPHHNVVGAPPLRRRCRCRKPRPGLLERACEDFVIDLERSAGVGDDVRDLQAYAALGLPGVLVGTGKGRRARQRLAEQGKDPDLYCGHLGEAVPWLLRRTVQKKVPSQA